VKVSFGHFGKIKVDNHIDSLNIYAASEKVTADEVPTHALPEVMEDAVPVFLEQTRR